MPSKKDPSTLKVGPGHAGRASVPASGLAFNPTALQGSSSGPLKARDVGTDPFDFLSGKDVQASLESLEMIIPMPKPNFLGEANTGVPNPNDVSQWTGIDSLVPGNFLDGASIKSVMVAGAPTVTLDDLIIFPADRGILSVWAGGVAIQALNLGAIFYEPFRKIASQPDYIAESSPNATVQGLPQGISLRHRMPTLQDYTGVGSPYDGYPYDFPVYQLATAKIVIPLVPGENGEITIRHHKTLEGFLANSAETYAVISPWGIFPSFYDDADTINDNVQISSFSFQPNDPAGSTPANIKYLSGVAYYNNMTADFNMTFGANNLFHQSFLEYGVSLAEPFDAFRIAYHEYNPSGADTVVTYSKLDHKLNTIDGAWAFTPELTAKNPLTTAIQPNANPYENQIILLQGNGFSTNTEEFFEDEARRYHISNIVQPGGLHPEDFLPDGFNSTWDSTIPVTDQPGGGSIEGNVSLQVRGISYLEIPVDLRGTGIRGQLSWPLEVNYGDGSFWPTDNQPDYTNPGPLFMGIRSYIRVFDMGAPKNEVRLRVVGKPTAGSTLAGDMVNLTASLYSPSGITLGLANPQMHAHAVNIPEGLGGHMLGYEEVSDYEVIFHVRIDNPPARNMNMYPIIFEIGIEEGSLAADANNFALYKVEIL